MDVIPAKAGMTLLLFIFYFLLLTPHASRFLCVLRFSSVCSVVRPFSQNQKSSIPDRGIEDYESFCCIPNFLRQNYLDQVQGVFSCKRKTLRPKASPMVQLHYNIKKRRLSTNKEGRRRGSLIFRCDARVISQERVTPSSD